MQAQHPWSLLTEPFQGVPPRTASGKMQVTLEPEELWALARSLREFADALENPPSGRKKRTME